MLALFFGSFNFWSCFFVGWKRSLCL